MCIYPLPYPPPRECAMTPTVYYFSIPPKTNYNKEKTPRNPSQHLSHAPPSQRSVHSTPPPPPPLPISRRRHEYSLPILKNIGTAPHSAAHSTQDPFLSATKLTRLNRSHLEQCQRRTVFTLLSDTDIRSKKKKNRACYCMHSSSRRAAVPSPTPKLTPPR